MPGGLSIVKSAIRGIESAGMLCSKIELGLAAEPKGTAAKGGGEGILILPKDAPVGAPFAEYMGLDDVAFELKVTPNRSDCLSHFGLAREVACILGRACSFPSEPTRESDDPIESRVRLDVRHQRCARYHGPSLRA